MCFECRKKDHMIKDCPIRKKKLAAKKPGQKHQFGRSTCQEYIENDDPPTEESNGGEVEEENLEDTEEVLHNPQIAWELIRAFHDKQLSLASVV